jgi:hypothetical protein
MLRRCAFVTVIVLGAVQVALAAEPPIEPDSVLLRKPLENGHELVVVRSPNVILGPFGDALIDDSEKMVQSVFSVRAELRSAGADAPLVLWSTVLPRLKEPKDTGIAILDATIQQKELVVALLSGANIFVYCQKLGWPVAFEGHATMLQDWCLFSVQEIIPADQIRLKLSLSEGGLWQADVTHRYEDSRQDAGAEKLLIKQTWFEQVKGKWEFKETATKDPRFPDIIRWKEWK